MKRYAKKVHLIKVLLLLFIIVLSANASHAGEVTLTWDPPTTNADGTPLTDLSGYRIYYGTQSGTYSQNFDVGNVTTYQVAGLTEGSSYYFAVTAYDTSGNESVHSNEVNKTVPVTTIPVTYYCDNDNDGYANNVHDGSCTGTGCEPAGCQTTPGNDCNDENANINPGASDSNCNAIDENCDGTADNNYVSASTSCGQGVCASTGQLVCSNGNVINTCTAGDPTGDDANCNGIDENCDGTADEGYIATDTSCGEGMCASSGQLICSEGTLEDTCTVDPECTEDTIPPSLNAVNIPDPNMVQVVFSEPVDKADAENIFNYSIDNDITITSASLDSDMKTVSLATSLHSENIPYTLTVNNIRDKAVIPNVIITDTQKTYTFVDRLYITNLTVSSGKTYEIEEDGLQTGSPVYIDRDYTFTTIPDSLQTATYIITANDDKSLTDTSFVSFNINKDATVYIAYDDSISDKPSWLLSFDDTGDDIVTTDTTLSIYSGDYSSGTVTLGANNGGGNNSMYSIIVKAGSDTTDNIDYYCDNDSDGYTHSSVDGSCTGTGCEPAGCQAVPGNDCDDTNAGINPGADDSSCNGIDEDCDGTADNHYVSASTSCGQGVCASTGQLVCSSGAVVNTCNAGNPTGDDSDCNGIDENCNGIPDDNYTITITTCGSGECTSTGQLSCQQGKEVDSCAPDAPAESSELTCDGLDNDCDGIVDEECSPAIRVSRVLLNEDFTGGIPDTWSANGAWNTENTCSKSIAYPLTEPFAIVDSSCMETDVDELITAPFSTDTCSSIELSYSNQYYWHSGSIDVSISSDGGATWTGINTAQTNDGYPVSNSKSFDITAISGDNYSRVMFKYSNSDITGHWAIDNVLVSCEQNELRLSSTVSMPIQETIVVTNTAMNSITVGMINIDGTDTSDFSISEDTCSGQSLLPDETCMFDIVFTPASAGIKSTNLVIPSTDPVRPVLDIAITGTGIEDTPTMPVPQIKANGISGNLTLSRTDNLTVTIELDPGSYNGINADWWVMFEYRNRWYYYNALTGKWRRGTSHYDQKPLADIGTIEVMSSKKLPKGTYTFYFMVDTEMNSRQDPDQLFSSEVSVHIQ